MLDVSKALAGVRGFFAKDWKVKLIVALGLLGMALILLSQFLDSGGGAPSGAGGIPSDTATARYTAEEYATHLEDRLLDLITDIEGVGEARILVTLEQGVEYVYAQEEKSTLDKSGDESGSKLRQDTQSSYVMVDTEYGRKAALVQTERQPKVQGVIIVCEGADDVRVEQKLIHVVTTALNITTTRVCVVKIQV